MDEITKGQIKPKSSSTELETPFDVVELPSKGKLYKGTSLEGKDSIEVKYLTATEEDILTSPNLLQSGKVLDVLVKSVLKDKTIKVEDLLLGDRNMILVWLRSTGYGAEYPITLSCQSCGHEHTHEFDLGGLDIKYLEEDPDEDGLFSCTLPLRKNTVRYKLLTAGDELAIVKKIEDRKKLTNSVVDNTTTIRMKFLIFDIDGNSDPSFVARYVDTMPVKDSKFLRQEIGKVEPGIIMEQDVTCPSCGDSNKEVIPIRANFFWPDS